VGTRTDAALAEVVAARAGLAGEVDRLEAAGRAAVDIPAKIKRSPAKAAVPTTCGTCAVLAQRSGERAPANLGRCRESEHHADDDGEPSDRETDSPIDADIVGARHGSRNQSQHGARRPD